MNISKLFIFFVCVFSLSSGGCSSSRVTQPENVNVESSVAKTDEIFSEVINSRPSPSEAKVVGERVDLLFSQIADADSDYVEKITALGWGDVYDPTKLNSYSNLDALMMTNSKSKDLLIETFQKRKLAYNTAFKDLEVLSVDSLLAKAMHQEIRNRFYEPETGFDTIEKEMLNESIEKFKSITSKLLLLKKSKGIYKVLPDGRVAFRSDKAEAEKLSQEYLQNTVSHNKSTARQRILGSFFMQNRSLVVARFHELTK